MTAIVGLIADDGSIYMGGDSCGTNKAGDQDVYQNKKVFCPVYAPEFIMGSCGSFRLMQVLRFHLNPPRPLPGSPEEFEEYIATGFSAALYKAFSRAGLFDDSIGEGIDGLFLVGYQGSIARIEGCLQAVIPRKKYIATGSGEAYAKGSLHATEGQDPGARVYAALKAAAEFSALVTEPFEVLRLPFDPHWTASKVKRKRGKKAK